MSAPKRKQKCKGINNRHKKCQKIQQCPKKTDNKPKTPYYNPHCHITINAIATNVAIISSPKLYSITVKKAGLPPLSS
jgi:hypothetical protein